MIDPNLLPLDDFDGDPFVLLSHAGIVPDPEISADNPQQPALFLSIDDAVDELERLIAAVALAGVTHWTALVCRLSEAATAQRPAPPRTPAMPTLEAVARQHRSPTIHVKDVFVVVVPAESGPAGESNTLLCDEDAVIEGESFTTFYSEEAAQAAITKASDALRLVGITPPAYWIAK
ncbi:hypothetical protein ACWFOB_23315, partial [Bacillus subtilis]